MAVKNLIGPQYQPEALPNCMIEDLVAYANVELMFDWVLNIATSAHGTRLITIKNPSCGQPVKVFDA